MGRSREMVSYRGVEQWKLVGPITRRSQVRILPPQLLAGHQSAFFIYIYGP